MIRKWVIRCWVGAGIMYHSVLCGRPGKKRKNKKLTQKLPWSTHRTTEFMKKDVHKWAYACRWRPLLADMILYKLTSSHRLHTQENHWRQPKRKPGASSIDASMRVDSSEPRVLRIPPTEKTTAPTQVCFDSFSLDFMLCSNPQGTGWFPTHTGEDRQPILFGLLIHTCTLCLWGFSLPEKASQTQLEIRLSQFPGHPLTWSHWHFKLWVIETLRRNSQKNTYFVASSWTTDSSKHLYQWVLKSLQKNDEKYSNYLKVVSYRSTN